MKSSSFRGLRLTNNLLCFAEPLQGNGVVCKIFVIAHGVRRKAYTLPRYLGGFLILSLSGVDQAQIAVRRDALPRIVRDFLLKRPSGFIEFSGYVRIVVCGDRKFFLLAGVFPQLKCFGVILAGPS